MTNRNKWRERTVKEKIKVFNNFTVLKVENIIVGGYGLTETEVDGIKGKVLECLFSKKTGIGDYVLQKLREESNNIFAYSKEESFFIKNGFVKIKGNTSQNGASLYSNINFE